MRTIVLFFLYVLIVNYYIILIFFLQFMKPVYQQFVEKSMSAAVAQAAEIATNSTISATAIANGKTKQT